MPYTTTVSRRRRNPQMPARHCAPTTLNWIPQRYRCRLQSPHPHPNLNANQSPLLKRWLVLRPRRRSRKRAIPSWRKSHHLSPNRRHPSSRLQSPRSREAATGGRSSAAFHRATMPSDSRNNCARQASASMFHRSRPEARNCSGFERDLLQIAPPLMPSGRAWQHWDIRLRSSRLEVIRSVESRFRCLRGGRANRSAFSNRWSRSITSSSPQS